MTKSKTVILVGLRLIRSLKPRVEVRMEAVDNKGEVTGTLNTVILMSNKKRLSEMIKCFKEVGKNLETLEDLIDQQGIIYKSETYIDFLNKEEILENYKRLQKEKEEAEKEKSENEEVEEKEDIEENIN